MESTKIGSTTVILDLMARILMWRRPHHLLPSNILCKLIKEASFPRERGNIVLDPLMQEVSLLLKAYGDGGDDIDYDRRQLSSSDESLPAMRCTADDHGSGHLSCISDYGDDNFAVGSWESKDIISRDGLMKLSTTVFFASIDPKSEKAAGQSACTALVAILADWFKSNQVMMPIKPQFDSLIQEGSRQWRNLREGQTYRERSPTSILTSRQFCRQRSALSLLYLKSPSLDSSIQMDAKIIAALNSCMMPCPWITYGMRSLGLVRTACTLSVGMITSLFSRLSKMLITS